MVVIQLKMGGRITAPALEHLVQTQRGLVPAKDVQQGDRICHITGEAFQEVVSVSVMS